MLPITTLQQIIIELGYENEIINLRIERQKDLYTVFTKRKGLKKDLYEKKNVTVALKSCLWKRRMKAPFLPIIQWLLKRI